MPNKQYWREAVEQLDPTTLEHYAQATGWRKVENIPDAVALYRRPESELDEILIPKDRSFADFSRQMASVVQFLAEFEDRSVLAVLNDILLPPSDVVRFILEGDETREATI
ncbi:MAG TPA: hypothetical protein PLU80_20335, partial [Acidobacteriota bacterium]|nr:hypothetical protein [Acidobacteriota bacterium]